MEIQDLAKSVLCRARRQAVRVAARVGVPGLYRQITGRRHLILILHRIRPADEPLEPFDTCPSHSAAVFREVLEYLAAHFRVVGLRELVARRNERVPLAAITFDDGWRDTHDVAFPLLREFGVPATVFVTTGKIGSCQPFWQQVLGEVFRQAIAGQDEAAERALRRVLGLPATRPLTRATYRQTVIQWKCLPACKRDRRMGSLPAEYPVPTHGRRLFLTEAEIKEMHSAGVEIGSHTVHYELLDKCPRDQLDRELVESKAQIEAIVGDRVESIAYPDGQYSGLVICRAEAAGYRIGCSTQALRVGPNDSQLLLPRLDPGVVPLGTSAWIPEQLCRRKVIDACNNGEPSVAAEDQKSPGTWCSPGSAAHATRSNGRAPAPSEQQARGAAMPSLAATAEHDRCAVDGSLGKVRLSEGRVLLLIDQYSFSHAGTEQHLLFLSHHLPRIGFDTRFAVLSAVGPAEAKKFPICPELLDGAKGSVRAFRFAGRIRRLSRLICSRQIDIVYAFCSLSELAAVLATRLARRARVVGAQRNIGYWHSRTTLWRARAIRRFVAHVVANCRAAAQFAVENEWLPSDRISVIPNPINLDRLEDGMRHPISRESAGLRAGEKVVGIVANVRPVKDYETFFRAARLVLDRHPQTRFLVVGDHLPEYRDRLLELVGTLGMASQVTWLGALENAYRVLPHFDVGVLSSRSEAFSNALLEYASAGVPAVATAVGGSPELVVDGQTGFLTPAGDPQAMASRINLLLEQPELARTLGCQAKERAFAVCDPEKVMGRYRALFARLLGRQRRSDAQQNTVVTEPK